MLHEIRSRTDWRMALKETQLTPDLIYFHFSIRQEMEAKFPESPIRVFTYPEHGTKKYWFMLKDNLFIDAYCMVAHVPSTSFIADEFIECLREFRLRALGCMGSERPHLMIGKEKLVKLYSGLMKKHTSTLVAEDLCLNLFYMTRDQEQLTLQVDPKVPIGYEESEISPYEEAELVNSTWKFAKDGDIEQTATKLARLPSACIRYNGEPVAFEMLDPAGFFNNQFVFEDHRRKGLGTAVELMLAQKCIRNQMTPYKTVYRGNKIVLEHSCKSPLWSRWEENGQPVTVIFQTWTNEANDSA
ncbi:unnamed protein product, partial [Mesorhabditis belari]|uniref:Glycine N-acyltransferase-like protein n=1 Tax=Mesorhabditis belari TaxID=2138241 RepID=A0AAF3EK82_9BILA